ncbi:MAG: AraC family transcriptional regulator N-terminal domain-containing protein [Gammaproteobacteria bacterium]
MNQQAYGRMGLAEKIARWTGHASRHDTAIAGLSLHRFEGPTEPTSYTLTPSVCLIGQGRKRVLLGEQAYSYDAHQFLINSVDLPLVAEIVEASADHPYLGLTLELVLRSIARLMLDSSLPSPRMQGDRLGIAVGKVSPPLLDAFERLLDLLDRPEDIPVLAPLIRQEICYRLLVSEQGPRLRQIASVETHSYQIAQAIDWLKRHFDQAIRVEDLAAKAGMSTSTFHHHFRSTTAMSPLQYQKRLRLNSARQLMLTEHLDAAAAAFRVGYESPSQFSREYSRLFGAPPLRDIRNLSQASVNQTL